MSDFKAKMHQLRFRLGLCPDPAGRAYIAPPDPLAGFKGPTSKGREGNGREGGEKEGEAGRVGIREGKGKGKEKGDEEGEKGREGKGWEGEGREGGGGRRRGKGTPGRTHPLKNPGYAPANKFIINVHAIK